MRQFHCLSAHCAVDSASHCFVSLTSKPDSICSEQGNKGISCFTEIWGSFNLNCIYTEVNRSTKPSAAERGYSVFVNKEEIRTPLFLFFISKIGLFHGFFQTGHWISFSLFKIVSKRIEVNQTVWIAYKNLLHSFQNLNEIFRCVIVSLQEAMSARLPVRWSVGPSVHPLESQVWRDKRCS